MFICATVIITALPYARLVTYYSHLSESKGTRKGSFKAKVGHCHSVDFSME